MHRSAFGLLAAALLVLAAGCATEPSGGDMTAGTDPSQSPTATASTASTAVVTPAPSASQDVASEPPTGDALLDSELTDVRSGESFTLAELAAEGPILLEPMAVWCSNCRAQQHEVKAAHETASFVSVSLDVDLSETAADLAAYAEREGFDWRFAMADEDLYRLLQERFGVAATNPPSTPLIVIATDGTVRPLEFGRGTRSAEQVIDELQAG
jgi:thiol-disulfide isomerase/thioredoxin